MITVQLYIEMRIVIQRVVGSSVTIHGTINSSIGSALLVSSGIEDAATDEDSRWLWQKTVTRRIFPDENEVMNKAILESDGGVVVVRQFTLHVLTKKGSRPSYIKASKPVFASPMYEKFVKQLETDLGKTVQAGEFGADMRVALINDGPVT